MFEDEIKRLAQAREELELAKAEQKRLLDGFQRTDDWVNATFARDFAAGRVDELESTIKENSVASGQKNPHEAVTVKLFTVVKIVDDAKAREWCMTNFRPALKLDTKVFEKAAKDGTVPADLAVVEEDPRAQIATDLSKYL